MELSQDEKSNHLREVTVQITDQPQQSRQPRPHGASRPASRTSVRLKPDQALPEFAFFFPLQRVVSGVYSISIHPPLSLPVSDITCPPGCELHKVCAHASARVLPLCGGVSLALFDVARHNGSYCGLK